MNTRLYQLLLEIKRKNEWSIRKMAKECNMSYAGLVKFFNPNRDFCPLRDVTKARLNNRLGVPYEVMDEYNDLVLKERSK